MARIFVDLVAWFAIELEARRPRLRVNRRIVHRELVEQSIRVDARQSFDKLEVRSIAPILAKAIDAVFEDTSVSELFGGNNQS